MEDFEKNNTDGEEIKELPEAEDIPSPATEEATEAEATEACEEATTEVVTTEPTEPPVEEAPKVYTYSWDYAKPTKKKKNSALIYAIVMTAAFLLAFTTLFVLLIIGALDKTDAAKYPEIPESSVVVEKTEHTVYVKEYDPASGVLTTQEAYTKCLPSVVSITPENKAGVGSGFIISEDGYIVTANHVVENMTQIRVILSDGTSYPAELIDGNEFTDIAVIKINATGLTPIEIGKSSNLLVGDSVMAIGTPASLDYAGTLATGHVSYLDRILKIYRSNNSVEKKIKLIQTNALVNPGNSGCPLINEYGEAIGLVTMKMNSTYYEGMCFAIPLDAAMPIVNAMIAGEDYDHLLSEVAYYPAVIGIAGLSPVTIQSSGEFGLRITSFTSNSYDAASKLRLGDIVVKLDGQAFNASADVAIILDRFAPGDTLNITVYRDGQYMTIPVTLGS